MLTSAGFGSNAARFLGNSLCEAQSVALLLAEHHCFALCLCSCAAADRVN